MPEIKPRPEERRAEQPDRAGREREQERPGDRLERAASRKLRKRASRCQRPGARDHHRHRRLCCGGRRRQPDVVVVPSGVTITSGAKLCCDDGSMRKAALRAVRSSAGRRWRPISSTRLVRRRRARAHRADLGAAAGPIRRRRGPRSSRRSARGQHWQVEARQHERRDRQHRRGPDHPDPCPVPQRGRGAAQRDQEQRAGAEHRRCFDRKAGPRTPISCAMDAVILATLLARLIDQVAEIAAQARHRQADPSPDRGAPRPRWPPSPRRTSSADSAAPPREAREAGRVAI